jgi:hypothetical protein
MKAFRVKCEGCGKTETVHTNDKRVRAPIAEGWCGCGWSAKTDTAAVWCPSCQKNGTLDRNVLPQVRAHRMFLSKANQ